ncbi:hypothetical protein [Stenotrophomonas rhizophila]|uniref:hypothetical protein n=1 Tax=Stenotrophomonas rhizophila TaxID=216778 RepID=UPI00112F1014|nr:hypothetical protein [Stenotrophomonas rhizophila]
MMNHVYAPPHAHGSFSRSTVGLTLLVAFFVGAHLRLSIYSGGSVLIPQFICLAAGAALAALYHRALLKALPLMLLLAAALVLAPILNFPFLSTSAVFETYKGSIQLLVSMTLMLAVAALVTTVEPARLAKLSTRLWLFFVLLALLEFVALRDVFEAISQAIYSASGRGVYNGVERDQLMYGQIRPKVMATEPSFLATTLLCLCTMAILSMRSAGKPHAVRNGLLMLAVTYLVCPSMIIVFFMAAIATWMYWPRTKKGRALVLFLLGGALVSTLIAQSYMTQLAALSKLALGDHGATGSFFGRIAVGPSVGIDVLERYPLLGVGVGNAEAARPIIDSNWLNKGAFALFPWFADPTLRANDLMSNGFWWQWIYMGAVGGLLFMALTKALLRTMGVALPFRAIVCAWIVWYAGAAFVDPISWFALAIFCIPPRADAELESPVPDVGSVVVAPGAMHAR